MALAGAGDGLEVVVVNPAGVYGPGPAGSASFEQDLFRPVLRGRLPAMTPGGCGVTFSDGIGRGQLLAAEKGRPGERYILCDAHVSIAEFARTAVDVAGRGRVPPTVPVPVARAIAAARRGAVAGDPAPAAAPARPAALLPVERRAALGQGAARAGLAPTELRDGVRRTLEAHGMLTG